MRSVLPIMRAARWCLLIGFLPTLLMAEAPLNEVLSVDLKKGKQVYVDQCARCHGNQGEGTEHFEDRLEGDLSVNELAELISDTMPEEDPERCVAEDAKAVAQFVHTKFYSEAARNRRLGARVELQRRTVRQYRQSIAELVGSFNQGQLWIPEERGLKAEYFAWGHYKEERRLSTQNDPKIDFAEEKGGVPHFRADNKYENVKEIKQENNMGKGFSVFWSGGLIAPKTGEYEFLVKCRNGFKLFLNDKKEPLIDRWVRSNDELEHRAKLFLIEGRPYYFHLNIFSYRDPAVSAQVFWQLPGGDSMTVVPQSAYIEHQPDEVTIVTTPFPADDASRGYERGSSISRQWDEATTDAAIETAGWISDRIERLSKAKETDDNRKEKVIQFCHRFAQRAFVDRMSKEELHFFVDQHFENELSINDQVKRVVLLTLKSPRFLYPELSERDRGLQDAERMAITLWDSLPDARLMKLAMKGKLKDEGVLYGEMERLLQDPRSRSKLRNFFAKWLKLDHISETSKDKDKFPEFDDELLRDLRASLEVQLDEFVWKQSADYRQLYLSDELYANSRIAGFYNLETNNDLADDVFSKVKFEPELRAGILTHPYLLTGLAYHKDSSPIHRGVFVARSLIGRRLRQPPDDVEPLTEELGKGMTTRERVEHQTKETACMNCHRVINPLGFSLENFDAVGKFREKELNKPINVATIYETPNGRQVKLNGPRDLAKFLAEDEMAQRSFIRHLFHHYTKQSVNAYGEETFDRLHKSLVNQDYNIQRLLIEIVKVVIED